MDSSGCAYVTGYTGSPDFPITHGAFDISLNGTNDAFVAKLSVSGSTLEYSTFIGGTEHESGRAIAVDSFGCAYVTGSTGSSDFPTTSGAFDTLHAYCDTFVAKLDPSGSGFEYSTFLGGTDYEFNGGGGVGIAVDSSGCAFVTGRADPTYPTTPGAFDTAYHSKDAFVTKLNPSGNELEYSTFLGGSDEDQTRGIAIDSSGCAYVTGWTWSLDFPTTQGAYDREAGGAFVAKLNMSGESGLAITEFMLTPDTLASGSNVSVSVKTTGAASVRLRITGLRRDQPSIGMAGSGGSWTASISGDLASWAYGNSLNVYADAHDAQGRSVSACRVLSVPRDSSPGGTGSPNSIWVDASEGNGILEGNSSLLGIGPLTARLSMTTSVTSLLGEGRPMNLWPTVTASGVSSNPANNNSLGAFLANHSRFSPAGGPSYDATFARVGDRATFVASMDAEAFGLGLWGTMVNAIGALYGTPDISPTTLLQTYDDFAHLAPVRNAIQRFNPKPSARRLPWVITLAAYDLSEFVTNEHDRNALGALIGATIGSARNDPTFTLNDPDWFGKASKYLTAWTLMKTCRDWMLWAGLTWNDNPSISFEACSTPQGNLGLRMESSGATGGLVRSSGTDITYSLRPSGDNTDYNFTLANVNGAPIWEWRIEFGSDAPEPVSASAPPGWEFEILYNESVKYVRWYTEGSEGWISGDFSSNTIAQGNSLAGFAVQVTARPEQCAYTVTDTDMKIDGGMLKMTPGLISAPQLFLPAKENTTLECYADRSATATLSIQQGSTVCKTLLSSTPKSAGGFSVDWDGKDANSNLLPEGHYLAVLALSYTDGDSAQVTTPLTIATDYKTDLTIKSGTEATYSGTDIFNTDGTNQTKSQSASPGQKLTYAFKVVNAGYYDDSFKLTGSAGGSGWSVKYYDLSTGVEVTSQVTGAGWSSGTLAPRASKAIFVKIIPEAAVPVGSVNTLLITATSDGDNTKTDVVKTITTFTGSYKTDMIIKAGSETSYTGTGIFNTNGSSQTKSLNVCASQKVTYSFRAQNAGNANDSFKITGTAGGNGWSVKYYDISTNAEVTSQITGSGWVSVTAAPKGYPGVYANVKPDSTVPLGSSIVLLITGTSMSDNTKTDIVKSVTTCVAAYKPDMFIKNSADASYIGTDVINTDGTNQTKSQNASAGQKVVYSFRVKNAGYLSDSIKITGTAGGSGWSTRYYDLASVEITSQVTGGGWSSGTLAPGADIGIFVKVFPDTTVPIGSSNTLLITATSVTSTMKKDVVKAVTNCVAAYKPDMLIKNSADVSYIGTDIFNADGTNQTKSQNASAGQKVTYSFRVKNAGYLSDSFKITGSAGGAGWSVRYYDLSSIDITSQVTGSGWSSGTLASGADRGFFVKVSPDTTVTSGSSKTILITATSVGDGTKKDVVKAVMMVP